MDSGCAGVEHVGGDMFVSIPKADAVFMKVSFIYLPKFPAVNH